MAITFDRPKRDRTLAARGLDFADAEQVFEGPLVENPDNRFDYGRKGSSPSAGSASAWWSWCGRRAATIGMSFRCERPMLVSRKDTKSSWVDPDDAPELDDEWFERAEIRIGDKVIRRGRPAGSTKRLVSLRLDEAVIDHFRATGPGWQTRVNEALRKAAGL
jgi:uncharacterized protein (DUF4415 family)